MQKYSKAIAGVLSALVAFIGMFWVGILEIATDDVIASATTLIVIVAGIFWSPKNEEPT